LSKHGITPNKNITRLKKIKILFFDVLKIKNIQKVVEARAKTYHYGSTTKLAKTPDKNPL